MIPRTVVTAASVLAVLVLLALAVCPHALVAVASAAGVLAFAAYKLGLAWVIVGVAAGGGVMLAVMLGPHAFLALAYSMAVLAIGTLAFGIARLASAPGINLAIMRLETAP